MPHDITVSKQNSRSVDAAADPVGTETGLLPDPEEIPNKLDNKSYDDLWSDDLFDDSIIRATQDFMQSESFNSPILPKRKSSGSPSAALHQPERKKTNRGTLSVDPQPIKANVTNVIISSSTSVVSSSASKAHAIVTCASSINQATVPTVPKKLCDESPPVLPSHGTRSAIFVRPSVPAVTVDRPVTKAYTQCSMVTSSVRPFGGHGSRGPMVSKPVECSRPNLQPRIMNNKAATCVRPSMSYTRTKTVTAHSRMPGAETTQLRPAIPTTTSFHLTLPPVSPITASGMPRTRMASGSARPLATSTQRAPLSPAVFHTRHSTPQKCASTAVPNLACDTSLPDELLATLAEPDDLLDSQDNALSSSMEDKGPNLCEQTGATLENTVCNPTRLPPTEMLRPCKGTGSSVISGAKETLVINKLAVPSTRHDDISKPKGDKDIASSVPKPLAGKWYLMPSQPNY